jgi:hypothetical protein
MENVVRIRTLRIMAISKAVMNETKIFYKPNDERMVLFAISKLVSEQYNEVMKGEIIK